MNLVALPALADNYIWMLHDGRHALVVDPGDAVPVVRALETLGLELAAILVTHHHGDHVAGIEGLRARLPDGGAATVHGPARERIPAPFVPHGQGDVVRVDALGLTFDVLDVPGHTAGHIAYVTRPDATDAPLLFCGDTLFSAGCGRLFEGTPAQMHDSLSRLMALPDATRVCCTHEYTLANLAFAAAVEPDNPAVAAATAWARERRAAEEPTLPSTIARERTFNPFVRIDRPTVRAAVAPRLAASGTPTSDDVAIFAALRQWKNEFR